jgi:hypothetical protein
LQLAKLCGTLTNASDTALRDSLQLLNDLVRQDPSAVVGKQDILLLSESLLTILVRSVRLRETDDRDQPAKAELFIDLVEAYEDANSSRLSRTWVLNLADWHKRMGNLAEAGICVSRAACTAAHELTSMGSVSLDTVAGIVLYTPLPVGPIYTVFI